MRVDLIEALFTDLTAERALERLTAAGLMADKVRTLDDVYAWEQTRSSTC